MNPSASRLNKKIAAPIAPPDFDNLMHKPTLTLDDVCALQDMARSTLDHVTRQHPIPWFYLGRRRYVHTADYQKWLREYSERAPKTKSRRGA